MFRNIFFNIILIAVVVFLSLKLYNSLTKPLSFPLESPQKQTSPQQDKKGDGNITNKNKEEMPGYQVPDYQVIVQKDIFKQIRAERRLEAPPPPPPPPLPAPRLIGITIIGDKARAFLEDLVTRTIKAYGINDSIADFIIKEIYSDKVALTRGNETVEVSIVKVKTTDERGIPKDQRLKDQRLKNHAP
ncbi:MAG: hypothetical protein CVV37_04680 [Nitrospira bacterium HGW-Nitrospira-1]|nr:MAG: hypothetical protein CVV37_04680 [Nitrospira bacterium HGW-Nitrospira-1]